MQPWQHGPKVPLDPTCLQVPVGRGTLGRIINVIGEPVDEQGPIGACLRLIRGG